MNDADLGGMTCTIPGPLPALNVSSGHFWQSLIINSLGVHYEDPETMRLARNQPELPRIRLCSLGGSDDGRCISESMAGRRAMDATGLEQRRCRRSSDYYCWCNSNRTGLPRIKGT